ncbi:von Willebrand factor A domain-containing protein 7 [Anabarilius grahami]|uniref:von Willebrand factor A domain-containing protein 7 n=1 Tax=Anabarilius grahami TaxID=495550 RepID=A0A3N0XKA7_ANAGA|nr:von Willebrand factor A domain-containing protein 7 [Anabarilius grahami]
MAEVCRDVAAARGRDFTLPINNKLTPTAVQRACSNSYSSLLQISTFSLAIVQTSLSNAAVDRKQLSTAHHFDNEDFKNGRDLITQGIASVKVSMKQGRYLSARTSLGAVCHTLQDFYSHSNWVELKSTAPFRNLIRPELPLNNLAGKCSHGGFFDQTSDRDPTGGINKDDISSNHGFLHQRAADMAINATMELLEDIRADTGNVAFLRLMGLSQISVLAFVFDTTGSLSNYITEAKKVTFSIIDSKRGTSEEPSEYILVQFKDQGFGPLFKTENADTFKERINALSSSDGLNPGMCLSGLLVTFLLTNSISSRSQQNVSLSRTVSQSDIQLYRDLAHISGGQTIEVTNSTLSQAAAVIADVITAGLVTVLYVERSPAIVENFSFVLDPSLSNVTVYVTGDSPVFTLYSPTGVSQSGSVVDGPLGSILTVGNLRRLKINADNRTGEWKISISSTSSYTMKVIGRNATLFVSVTGGDSVTVTDVLLVEASGSGVVNGTIKAVGATDFLVNVDRIPEGAFVVQLKGLLNDSSRTSRFQRQLPTQYKGSRITITAQSQNTALPGVPFSLNFTVASNTIGGNYTIRARTDLVETGVSFPSSLNLVAGGSAQGSVTLTIPSKTESGTAVTLSIEAEAPGSTDLNYAIVQLTVSTAMAVFLFWGTLFQPPQVAAFKPLVQDGSVTHREITQMAILRKTAEVCRDIATAEGRDFTLAINNKLTASAVQKACATSPDSSSALSSLGFYLVITEIYVSNAAIDAVFALSAARHIDNEAFVEGRDLITRGMAAVKASVQQESFISARITLGALCHTLQDFYSHSNWVELGSTAPFSTLIRADLPLNNLAGKCSHGGFLDRTSYRDPIGGINKDDISSSHGFLHQRAADMAINATMEMLQDIRLATGNRDFLRLMGLSQTSVLAFVIDTTGSMSDDIEEAKRVSFSIIDSRKGTSEEPSEYILVPFNDPDFGPLTRTKDADVFKARINSLTASGGGDEPEMCLSGLLLALAGAPPSSDIFVFTDASAKDSELKSTVQAMIERTKSTVTFMLTNPFSFRRRRDVSQSQQFNSRSIPQSDLQLYRDLAHISGGQAIEVTRATLSQATAVITDASTSVLVTVLQVVRSPAVAESFSFVLDPSLSNVTVYITGDSPVFTLYSPTGVSQSGSVADGPLGSILTVGNLRRIKLNSDNQTGEWKISINSTSFYSLKVTGEGQSSVNFLFNFVEQIEGGDLAPKANRPFIGQNTTLLVSVTGGDSVTVTDVLLVEASGSGVVNGTIKAVGATDFLVNVDRIPEGAFVVQLKGLLYDSTRSLPSRFQRQSPTQQQGSRVTITAQPNSTIEPGIPFDLNFTLVSNPTESNYTIRAQTDRGFSVSFPSSLNIGTEGSAQGTVTLTAPSDTESGTDVTLTIEAEDPGTGDSNYVALRFSVMTKVTDFSSPVCQVVSIKADCPVECSTASWEISANLTDGRNSTLLVSVTGGDSVTVTDVLLVEASGSGVVNGTIKAVGATDFLVNVDRIPEGAFVVQLKGLLNDSTRSLPSQFQRQLPTQYKGSRITITAQSQNTALPGVPFSLNFTVASNYSGNYTIRARTDLVETDVSFPSSLILVAGGSAQGSVTLTIPSKTESGTAVTLTIEAEAPGSTDLNYAIVQLTVSTASKCSMAAFLIGPVTETPPEASTRMTSAQVMAFFTNVLLTWPSTLLWNCWKTSTGHRQPRLSLVGYMDLPFTPHMGLMGLRTPVLAFVIDTTGSMSDDIEEAKRVSFSIIDSRRGTPEEPSGYILVPFNDPDFGPLTRTKDVDVFKARINSLTASGGGDEPEMCLSGLLLALAGAPPSSDIFVFTDASAKDSELRSIVQAMIQITKSTSDLQLYRDLAHISGGQAIEVTRATLSQATAVITDASTSALVTVLQVVRSPAIAESFSFVLDPSLSNVTVYITGDSPVFTLYSPTGVSQSGSVADGPLGSILTVGNLRRIKLSSDNQTGEWKISINSTSFYSLKVTGQSSVNFLFNFVEQIEGGDFTPKANRPFIGRNSTLFVSVTGGDSVTVTDVLLVEASGSGVVNGTIKAVGATDFLVNVDRIPEGAFVVQLKGLLNDSTRSLPSRFQRQSPTQQQGSRVTITAQPNSTIEPGIPFDLNFTLVSNPTESNYTIRARTDRGFSVSFPSSLNIGTEGSAQGTVTLTAPSDTESGTDVTLTIEAEDPGTGDSNYVALRFSVMTKVTDFSSPVCQVVSIKADCPVECSTASWEISANLTDGNGTGISRVSFNRGNGSLSLSIVISKDGTNVTVASYNASCCSQEVELVVVDRVGNVGTCFTSIKSLFFGLGGDSVTVTDVLLVEASGSGVVNGTIKAVGATDFLVNIDRIPEGAFVVQLKGLLNDSTRSLPSRFQRQSPTQQQGSRVTITAQPNSTIEPGIPFDLNFTLVSNPTESNYTTRAWTDRGFSVSFPSSLNIGTEGSAQGTVTLTAPSDTESGTDVTLTIEAEDPGTGDSNYVALRFSVMTKVTDFSSPVCQVVSIKADCPVECSTASWEISANLTDGNGTGISRVSFNRGNGSLSLSIVITNNPNKPPSSTPILSSSHFSLRGCLKPEDE